MYYFMNITCVYRKFCKLNTQVKINKFIDRHEYDVP